jgi:hypothetical protein
MAASSLLGQDPPEYGTIQKVDGVPQRRPVGIMYLLLISFVAALGSWIVIYSVTGSSILKTPKTVENLEALPTCIGSKGDTQWCMDYCQFDGVVYKATASLGSEEFNFKCLEDCSGCDANKEVAGAINDDRDPFLNEKFGTGPDGDFGTGPDGFGTGPEEKEPFVVEDWIEDTADKVDFLSDQVAALAESNEEFRDTTKDKIEQMERDFDKDLDLLENAIRGDGSKFS